MTAWDRVERLIGSDNLARLARKRVAVVGLGSGGAFVAQSLAMSGVGNFVLIDDDTLEVVNVVRHIADRRYLDQPKAEVTAELIRLRNPEADIDVHVGRVEDHLDALDNVDLLVVGVDGEGSKYRINQACLERRLPAVYAGVYERGEGGDVVVIHPYDGPCYACWAAELREGLMQAPPGEADKALDYGMIGPEGTLEAEPGLWLHVVRVAAAQADMALKELLHDGAYDGWPGNTLIMANNAIEIIDGEVTPPHSAVWVTVMRDPNCLVCGDRARDTQSDEASEPMSLEQLTGAMGIDLENEHESQEKGSK
jgi:molybdopterin/thiamine biosynthesis adenylyltransferase